MGDLLIVPDSIEPYIGYKALRAQDGRLRSMAFPLVWIPRQKAEARCGYTHSHQAPARMCECGIYAADVHEAMRYYRKGRVVIEVALWGDVVVAVKGARGQYAYPQKILACDKTQLQEAQEIADVYGIPFAEIAIPDPNDTKVWSVRKESRLNSAKRIKEYLATQLEKEVTS